MSKTKPVPVRLLISKIAEYEKAAGKEPLSTYLRKRIESQDAVIEEVRQLKKDLLLFDKRGRDIDEEPEQLSIFVELLLLLRSLANPDKVRAVQAEMKRLGIPVFQMEDE